VFRKDVIVSNDSSGNESEVLQQAWELYEKNDLDGALDIATPYRASNVFAASICILIGLVRKNTKDLDEMILAAESFGVRDFWDENQSKHYEFSLLMARLDGINISKDGTVVSAFEFAELTQFILEGFTQDLSFHKSIIQTRRLWEESSHDIQRLSRYFQILLQSEGIDDQTCESFLRNLVDLINWSLSKYESKKVFMEVATSLVKEA
jgi:hypothetical protein